MSPFMIFPEKVWEIILDHLESSKDMLEVVKAYPELHPIVIGKGPLWQFDQILPGLYPWLPQKEFFYCRRVCKRWSRVVDRFLETHHDKQATGQLWLPHPGNKCYSYRRYFKGIRLQSSNFIGKFMKDMEGLGSGRGHGGTKNPFPGRSVIANVRRTRSNVNGQFYGRFGPHIWFIKLGCQSQRSGQVARRLRFVESLMRTLTELPNLKRLHLSEADNYLEFNGEEDPSSGSEEDWNYDCEEEGKELVDPLKRFPPLPPLPYLTTLEIVECPIPPLLAHMLIAHYSPQLERLLLQAKFWNDEVTSFPSLTQLNICDVEWKEMITEAVLGRLDAPHLTSIQMGLVDYSEISFSMETDVFPWLRWFPELTRLHMYAPFAPSPSDPNDDSTFSSLKSLQILDQGLRLNYNFLLRFPSLEELEILESSLYSSHPEIVDSSKQSSVGGYGGGHHVRVQRVGVAAQASKADRANRRN